MNVLRFTWSASSCSCCRQRVAVIGAGACGLCAAKYLLEVGFDVTVYEIGSQIGGMWRFMNDNGRSSAYRTLHINTSRGVTRFSDLDFDAQTQDFPDHIDMHRYLVRYAEHFGVAPRIRFNAPVTQIHPAFDPSRDPPRWSVRIADGSEETFDAVIVATGHLTKPYHVAAFTRFGGEYLHSHDYKAPETYLGKCVCVVGIGNSACDIASDRSFQSWFAKVRAPEHRVFPPLPSDSALRDRFTENVEYAADNVQYQLRPFPHPDLATDDPHQLPFIADKGDPNWPEVSTATNLKNFGNWIDRESFVKSVSVSLRMDGRAGLSVVFPLFVFWHFSDPVAGGWIVNRMYFMDDKLRDFGRNLLYTTSASRWLDGYFSLGVVVDEDDVGDKERFCVAESGIKFCADIRHSPLSFLAKLTDFWGVRAGLQASGLLPSTASPMSSRWAAAPSEAGPAQSTCVPRTPR